MVRVISRFFLTVISCLLTKICFFVPCSCDVCDADPTCIYVLSTGRDCFLASRLDAGAIGLDVAPVGDYTVIRKETLKAYWMDSTEKRGDFCDLCVCDEDTLTIDCR